VFCRQPVPYLGDTGHGVHKRCLCSLHSVLQATSAVSWRHRTRRTHRLPGWLSAPDVALHTNPGIIKIDTCVVCIITYAVCVFYGHALHPHTKFVRIPITSLPQSAFYYLSLRMATIAHLSLALSLLCIPGKFVWGSVYNVALFVSTWNLINVRNIGLLSVIGGGHNENLNIFTSFCAYVIRLVS
jgi:hypothetical protein